MSEKESGKFMNLVGNLTNIHFLLENTNIDLKVYYLSAFKKLNKIYYFSNLI